MRRFYNLREWKELLIACVTDACLWIVRRINRAPNPDIAYALQVMARGYELPVKPGHCGEGWCTSNTSGRCACVCNVCLTTAMAKPIIKKSDEYVFWEQN